MIHSAPLRVTLALSQLMVNVRIWNIPTSVSAIIHLAGWSVAGITSVKPVSVMQLMVQVITALMKQSLSLPV